MPKPKVLAFFNTPATNLAVHTIENGVHKSVLGWYLRIDPLAKTVEVLDMATHAGVAVTDHESVVSYLDLIIDISFAPTQYGNVKGNNLWKQMYQHGDRPQYYVYGVSAAVPHTKAGFPCIYCGIVLPEDLITVDHQRPQAGGGIEAIAKVFRVLNLTGAGPKGFKGAALQGQNLTRLQLTHPTFLTLPPIPTKLGRGPSAAASTLDQRYTLSLPGIILYSIVVAAGAFPELEARCMHSLLNLAPACQSCNSSRGNAGLKY